MPFVSESQRRFMYAKHPELAEEFEAATPKGAKLPKKLHPEKTVKKAYLVGLVDAYTRFGIVDKTASAEIRMKIPQPKDSTFHGFDQAWKEEAARGQKRGADTGLDAEFEPQGNPDDPVEKLTQMIQALPPPPGAVEDPVRSKLDRNTTWGAPSSLAAGDAGSRQVGGMGPTGGQPVF